MLTSTDKSVFWKAVEYLFYLFFATFPFIHYSSFLYSGTATRSLNLVIFASVLGIGLGAWLLKKGNAVSLVNSPVLLALGAYLLALSVSGILGLDFSTTFWSVATRMTGLWYFLSLGVVMLMLWVVIADGEKRHRLILAVIVSTVLYSVLLLVSKDGLGWFFKDSITSALTFGNTTFATMYVFGAFLLSLYYLLQAETKKWWMYLLPILLLINPLILNKNVWSGDFSSLVGEARATSYAVLGSILALGVLWLISKIKDAKKRALTSYVLFGVGLLTACAAAFSLLSPGGYLHEAYLSRASAARPLVWEMSQRAIGERPLLGWGADNFERVFERYYDNRLLQDEYGGEAWFDRAHNIFIDQMVDNGLIGLLLYFAVYIAVILALVYVALNGEGRRDKMFASILIVYFTLHIAELQTAFDTSISYPMLAFMFVSAGVLYHRARARTKDGLMWRPSQTTTYGIGTVLVLFFSWSFIFGALPLAQAEITNGEIRTIGSAEKRLPLYPTLFSSPLDVQAFLWRTSTDFQRGIAQDPSVLENPQKVEGLKKEMVIYENGYREYLKTNPDNFRAHLNLADVLIYQRLFEVDKLAEAQEVLDDAILLVPQSPQPYWMKAVAYVYMRKFDLAREYAKKSLALNPKIVQSRDVVKYVEDSIKTFPEIDLFFFRQI